MIIEGMKVTECSIEQLHKLTSSIDIPVAGRKVVKAPRLVIAGHIVRRILGDEKMETAGADFF
jgi:hypothetical protein